MWSISALLASCLTTWKAIFQPTKVGCHLGPGHLPFKGSAQAVPSACDLRSFSPHLLRSGKHPLVKARLKHHFLCEAVLDPLHGKRHFPLVSKSTMVLWPYCWQSTYHGALE